MWPFRRRKAKMSKEEQRHRTQAEIARLQREHQENELRLRMLRLESDFLLRGHNHVHDH